MISFWSWEQLLLLPMVIQGNWSCIALSHHLTQFFISLIDHIFCLLATANIIALMRINLYPICLGNTSIYEVLVFAWIHRDISPLPSLIWLYYTVSDFLMPGNSGIFLFQLFVLHPIPIFLLSCSTTSRNVAVNKFVWLCDLFGIFHYKTSKGLYFFYFRYQMVKASWFGCLV